MVVKSELNSFKSRHESLGVQLLVVSPVCSITRMIFLIYPFCHLILIKHSGFLRFCLQTICMFVLFEFPFMRLHLTILFFLPTRPYRQLCVTENTSSAPCTTALATPSTPSTPTHQLHPLQPIFPLKHNTSTSIG